MLGMQSQVLARYMDLLLLRQRVTAANVTNADTPDYHTQDVDFGWEMARALDNREAGPHAAVSVRALGGQRVKNEDNDISLDREMQVLAETAIRFDLAATLLKGKINAVRSAIHEGRGGGCRVSRFGTLHVSGSGRAAQAAGVEILAQSIANAETTRTDRGGPYRRGRVTFEADPQAAQSFRAVLAGVIPPIEQLTPGLHGVRVSVIRIDGTAPERRRRYYLAGHCRRCQCHRYHRRQRTQFVVRR